MESIRKETFRGHIKNIGLAGRYPASPDLTTFWENLAGGRDCIEEIPASRWDHRPFYDPDPKVPDKTYAKWGGFIDGVDLFDPLFFRISPKDGAHQEESVYVPCPIATPRLIFPSVADWAGPGSLLSLE